MLPQKSLKMQKKKKPQKTCQYSHTPFTEYYIIFTSVDNYHRSCTMSLPLGWLWGYRRCGTDGVLAHMQSTHALLPQWEPHTQHISVFRLVTRKWLQRTNHPCTTCGREETTIEDIEFRIFRTHSLTGLPMLLLLFTLDIISFFIPVHKSNTSILFHECITKWYPIVRALY